jgi:glycosyltransferase involved in cell wall biosynthesis
MSTPPLVSVAVPVHNGERFLGACIDSVLAQRFQDWELLLVDDASSDASAAIARRYPDPRIRFEPQSQRGGQTATRNLATSLARGRYLAVLDQDDVCLPDRLAKQVAFLERHPEVAAVGASKIKIDAGGRRLRRDRKPLLSPDELASQLVFKMCFVHPTLLFRREVLETSPHDEHFVTANDYELMVRLARREKLWNLPDILLGYRSHEANLSKTAAGRALEEERQIVGAQLAALGLDFTPLDLERHLALSQKSAAVDADFLDWADAWLRRLCEANDATGHNDRAALRRVASQRWLVACARGARQIGAATALARFAASPLAAAAALGPGRRAAYAARYRLSGRI